MENQININNILSGIKRRLKPAIIVGLAVLLASIAYALLTPATYKSYSTILIEQQEIPQDLVRTTVTSIADQRIQMIVQRVMTFSKLSEIIKKYDLYKEDRVKQPMEVIVDRMKNDINHRMISAEVVDPRSGRPVEATIAFSLAYFSESPATAQKVANELTSLFLSENVRNRTEMAEEAESFLFTEVERLEKRSQELEAKLAEFKEKNLRKLPELTSLNMSLMERTEREYFDVGRQIQALEERRVYLESQLAQQDPQAATVGDSYESVLTPKARARLLQNRYISLLATYSPDHPDVVKTKRELDKIVGEGNIPSDSTFINKQVELYEAELAKLKSKYDDEHPDVQKLQSTIDQFRLSADAAELRASIAGENVSKEKLEDANNPAYVQLATALEGVKVDLEHRRDSRKELKQKLNDLETAILDAPKVEKEYRVLVRDYENTTAKYREVKAKQLEARMASTLEQERKGERFTLIEPPITPVKPEKPNRLLLGVVGVLLAIAAAGGVIFLLEKTDPTFHTPSALQQFLGAPPLANIPHIVTVGEQAAHRRMAVVSIAACVLLLVSATAAVHLAYMPLDVLWYVALRKLG